MVPIFKHKGDITLYANYHSIQLTSHAMKMWEKIIEKYLHGTVEIWNGQYGLRPGRSKIDAIFALQILMEKFSKKRWQLGIVFVDLEKVYDHVPR